MWVQHRVLTVTKDAVYLVAAVPGTQRSEIFDGGVYGRAVTIALPQSNLGRHVGAMGHSV